MTMQDSVRYSLGFALLGAVCFIPFLGGAYLIDWDEVNFAEISREMLLLRDFTRVHVNFEPFFEKPPFFFWLQAGAMAVFGVSEFAARFPNAVCGAVTLALLFRIGEKLKGTRFGILWAGAYFGSILPFVYFKSGIIDPWYNLFIFLGLYFFILFYWKKEKFKDIQLRKSRWWYLFLGGFWIGMGILTKGQAAYLIAVLTMGVYWVYQRFRFYVTVPQFLVFTISAALVSASWYGIEGLNHGSTFIYEFTKYQYRLLSTPDAGHAGFPGYHFIVLLVGGFPASIFAVRSFFRLPNESKPFENDFTVWMKFLFCVVLVLFTLVRSKIIHYSSMCYFPIAYLAALTMEKLLDGEIRLNGWMKCGLWLVGGGIIVTLLSLPFIGMNAEMLKPLFDDPFARGALEAQIVWTGFEIIPGLGLLGTLAYFAIGFGKGPRERRFLALYGGTAVFVMLTLVFFFGRIEGYIQRAPIEFFAEKAGQDAYLATYGYKTYAHLFYGRPKSPGMACFKDAACMKRLFYDPLDRPAYIVTKIHRAYQLKEMETLEEIGRKNGFVFFQRKPG